MRYKSGLQLKKTQTQLNKQTIDKINGKNRNISVNMGTEELVAVQRKHSRNIYILYLICYLPIVNRTMPPPPPFSA
jgi:hypothetical protein